MNDFAEHFMSVSQSESSARSALETALRDGGLSAVVEGAIALEAAWLTNPRENRPYYVALRALVSAMNHLAPSDALRLAEQLFPRLRHPGSEWMHFATTLPSAHPAAALLAAFPATPVSDGRLEFFACLHQEILLRVPIGIDEPALDRFAGYLAAIGHPFGDLPARRAPFESGIHQPGYGWHPDTHVPPFGPPIDEEVVTSDFRLPPPKPERWPAHDYRGSREPATNPDDALARTAFERWVDRSNGKIDLRRFDGTVDAARLFHSGMACMAGASFVELRAIPAWRLYASLFFASSWGGAYVPRTYYAYGRLGAWRSLKGLLGLPEDAPPALVIERAGRMRLYKFETDAPWFHRVAWDKVVVVESPDTDKTVVLAVTDTD